jgi:KaiC/GvpD/RAD55 family RecA-like ATPase
MRWGRRAFADLRAFDTVVLHAFPIGVREELFDLMAHDFDGIWELRSDRTADRVRYVISIQKMRMTVVPPKLYELEVENNLLTLKAIFQRIT